jgi:hypothetical protein
VQRGHQIVDWKTLYDQINEKYDEVVRDRDAALSLVTQLRDKLNSAVSNNKELAHAVNQVVAERNAAEARATQLQSEIGSTNKGLKALGTRERESLLKLVIGMAVGGYAYDPRQRRSDKIAEIVGDLERAGVDLDADTVRKWLKEAGQLLPPAETE